MRPTKTATTSENFGRAFATQTAAIQNTQAAAIAKKGTTMKILKDFVLTLAFVAFILALGAYLDAPQLPESNTMEYSSD